METHKTPEGLTAAQVRDSQQKYGINLETTRDYTTLKIILKTLFSVFNIIMIVLVVFLLLIKEKSTGQFIGIIAGINTTIELVQGIRARLIIKKLSRLTQKTAKVIRDNHEEEIPLEKLVIGDVLHLTSGDRVPVDGTILTSEYAEFDESILTGESKYIEKKKNDEVRAGSFVAAGGCFYKMTKFVRNSYIQSITAQIAKQGITESPLQSQINQIIKALTYMTIFFIILLVAEGLVQESRKEEIIINASTLVTSLVPQGLVLITTLSFAYGAMNIARKQAIVQKLSAIEAMANTKIVCMDKTGTLTKNVLEVRTMQEI